MKVLLVGAQEEVLEARRVILEGAGFEIALPYEGESVREAVERTGAGLVIVDTSADVHAALEELSAPDSPSSVPVLVIGEHSALEGFEGPGEAVSRPADKLTLIEKVRSLTGRPPRTWSRRRRGGA